MSKITHILFLICLALSCAGNVHGQAKDSILLQLRIMDSIAAKPLEYCTIEIRDAADKTIGGGITNTSGIFQVVIPAGIVSLHISRTGYMQKHLSNIKIAGTIEILLWPKIEALKTVTVAGRKVQRDVDKLTYKVDHNKFPEATKALRVLKDVPLLAVDGTGAIQVKNSSNVMIYVNGKLATAEVVHALTAGMIKTVEVITNPSAAFDADGGGSIINIVLEKPAQHQLRGNAGFILGDSRKLFFPSANINFGTQQVFATASLSFQKSVQNAIFDTHRFNAATTSSYMNEGHSRSVIYLPAASAAVFYDLDSSAEISATISVNKNKVQSDINSADQFQSNTRVSVETGVKNLQSNYDAAAEYKKRFSIHSGMTIDYRFSAANATNSRTLSTSYDNIRYLLFADSVHDRQHAAKLFFYTAFFQQKLKAEYGVAGFTENIVNRFSAATIEHATGIFEYDTANTDKLLLKQSQLAAFATGKFKLAGCNWRLGLRYEYFYQTYRSNKIAALFNRNYHNLFPNMVVQKKLGKTALLFNYQRKIRRPDASVLSPFVFKYGIGETYRGNKLVQAEFINKYELNFDINNTKAFYELSAYVNHTRQPIVYLTSSADSLLANTYANAGWLVVSGLSVAAKFDLTDKIQVNVNGFGGLYKYAGELASTSRRSGFNCGISINYAQEIPGVFSIYADLHYKRLSYEFQSYTLRYPDINVSAERSCWKDRLLIGLGWNSVFNNSVRSQYRFSDAHIQQVRNSRSTVSMVNFSVTYIFGKYFMRDKTQQGIEKQEVKTLEVLK